MRAGVAAALLTTPSHFVRFDFVPDFFSHPESLSARRLTGAASLFFVLFLPFHLHLHSAKPELIQECACCCGVRTQVAAAPSPTDWTPDFPVSAVEIYHPQIVSLLTTTSQVIRGPPQNASL